MTPNAAKVLLKLLNKTIYVLIAAGTYSKVLSLTSCASHQFTCDDGLCIDLERR